MGIYIKGATLSVELKEIFKELDIMDNLIEVETPHGRLIDADKPWACVLEQVENMPPELEITEREKDITLAVISGLILQMPTVIEAEVE